MTETRIDVPLTEKDGMRYFYLPTDPAQELPVVCDEAWIIETEDSRSWYIRVGERTRLIAVGAKL